MLYLWVLVFLAFIGTFGWRLLGLVVSDRINPDSQIFLWVNAVAYAMVSGVMMLIVIFPNGAVAETPLEARLAALVTALGVMIWQRNMIVSILAGLSVYAAVTYFLP